MTQKVITVILAILIVIKVLGMIIVIKVMIEVSFYSFKIFYNYLFIIISKWVNKFKNFQVIAQLIPNRWPHKWNALLA